ncbi:MULTISPECIES: dihydrolipoyllysine-residue acetyltransferase [Methylocaldum]|jgi:pyruvate dehydrogenase E2 component (dihydrolipoamide acetyltransferase)|uniref:dihydrolipoyllysine-residue acetyltransferase n=1 Tax=unclassified Methylocaldum TaxID=2622260 RepID=UPI00098AD194|nr:MULTISPECIES: dihydrolipoyllysine-residue acetyltransferase [unclassified Methylocaldum]MBP1152124.1 pyruvate dehydrogenase E2 component (dihydrolipoamide acetyltransferase) [Methylocaldum sp. RMAD-M]MVF20535.1 dihydrolipoyllysine-residue acetyltransferase [Methylocaldum sp. BRCS4]
MAVLKEVVVPDIGDFKNVEIIEVLVKPGDVIKADDSLITLESDKAAMEVPSPFSGVVKEMQVNVGDRVSMGSPILQLELADRAQPEREEKAPPEAEAEAGKIVSGEAAPKPVAEQPAPSSVAEPEAKPKPAPAIAERALKVVEEHAHPPHASPSIRKFARELGAELQKIQGTGPKGRILKEDVQAFVKASLKRVEQAMAGGVFAIPPQPEIDFAQFGTVDRQPLSRIKKLSGPNLLRSWMSIPHVTQHDEADITDLEAFRQSLKSEAEKQNVKLTFLPFVIKAVAAALKEFPTFNSSLAANGEELILKKYYHLGVAVDTPEGLVVPVVRDVDQKGIFDLARELAELGAKARGKKLRNNDLEGASFTISSLGGIGGTAFTPIINPPQVAILGLSRAQTKPVYLDGQFVPRLMLPLSLSYDHRVIDGAEAARFTVYLAGLLAELRRVLL